MGGLAGELEGEDERMCLESRIVRRSSIAEYLLVEQKSFLVNDLLGRRLHRRLLTSPQTLHPLRRGGRGNLRLPAGVRGAFRSALPCACSRSTSRIGPI